MKAISGIRAFGILFTILGIAKLLGGWMLLGHVAGMDSWYHQKPDWTARSVSTALTASYSLLDLGCGVGLLELKAWARGLVLIIAVTSAILTGAALLFDTSVWFFGLPDFPLFSYMNLGWNLLVIWYFMRPGVRAQFQKTTANL